jgi:pseudouridine-5'-phosphate glycosidase
LESTLITHGLPWPINLETAQRAEQAVRAEGAIPATIALLEGRIRIGLTGEELTALARSSGVLKASRRDLAAAIVQGRTAATTVAATMYLAHRAGIRIFATGGIGGVHRGGSSTLDVSADLHELARTPVAVVCAGAKSILDIPMTLEVLETLGVPVVGYGVDDFPAFYLRSSGEPLPARIDTPRQAAAVLRTHWDLQGTGVVIAQPPPLPYALDPDEFTLALQQAEAEAAGQGIRGKAVTPFLLSRLAEHTQGKTLTLNRELIVANAGLAAQIAAAFHAAHSP